METYPLVLIFPLLAMEKTAFAGNESTIFQLISTLIPLCWERLRESFFPLSVPTARIKREEVTH